jgi:hypothetical protein
LLLEERGLITVLSERPEEIQRFCAAPWQFQLTFKTPLKDLSRFVSTFLAHFPLERGALSVDLVVFEPKNLLKLFARKSLQLADCWNFNLRAEGQQGVLELLEAALGDWVDFSFVPTPESFAIYADHDEYTTIYANGESDLAELTRDLKNAGFESVAGYTRGGMNDGWR